MLVSGLSYGELEEKHSRRGLSPVVEKHLNCRAALSLEKKLPGHHLVTDHITSYVSVRELSVPGAL